jgi:hypothetical protein
MVQEIRPTVLSTMTCNPDSVWACILMIPMIFVMIIALQLIVYTELYEGSGICWPILYYYGAKDECKQMVTREAMYRTYMQQIQTNVSTNLTYQEKFTNRLEDTKNFTQSIGILFSDILGTYTHFIRVIMEQLRSFRKKVDQEFVTPYWYKNHRFL